jgi:hypothetical protein
MVRRRREINPGRHDGGRYYRSMRLAAALLLLVGLCRAEEQLWLAVGPADLLKPLAPLAKYRADQGLHVVVRAGGVKAALAEHAPAFLLLVGDHAAGSEKEAWHLPAKTLRLYRWRKAQAETYASDAAWGDRDGDGLPECAVGRIPARTPAEVAEVVRKTIAYETRVPTVNDLRLVVWAGAPGYGGLVDAFATLMLVTTVRNNAPQWMSPWIISADARQALCGWPLDHAELFSRALREGSLMNAIGAHGNADATYSMRHEGRWIIYTALHAARFLKGDRPVAPLIFLACNCAKHDGVDASLAERLLFLPGGPVATLGATTESHPLTNNYLGACALRALDGKYGRHDRLGALWLESQRHAAKERDLILERMLKDVEGKLEPEIDVAKLRRDQQLMYALLGDPALRLPLPRPLEATIDADGHWKATRVEGATELHVAFRSVPRKMPPLPGKDAATRRLAFAEANQAEGYTARGVLRGDSEWTGRLEERGQLRLVATGPGVLRVAVLER